MTDNRFSERKLYALARERDREIARDEIIDSTLTWQRQVSNVAFGTD